MTAPITPKVRIVKPPDIVEIILGTNIVEMADKAVQGLGADPYVYQRAGELVHVVLHRDRPDFEATAAIHQPSAVPVITSLKVPTLRERLSTDCRFLTFDKSSGGHKAVTPPEIVVQAVSCRGQWPGVRPLVGVITAPTMRPDGTILQEPGYDPSTGLLYLPGDVTYPHVDDEPTLDQCRHNFRALAEVARDFPFAKKHHFSAWLAGLLTCIARPAIDGPCPLFAVDATTRGTGKTRLVQATARLAFGQEAAAFSQPEDEDEIRKRITSILYRGDSLVLIDNVAKTLGGASLDAVLTSTTWADRQLGSNATIQVPNRPVWWATGNNLALQGDLARRTVQIRLESNVENPEERTGFLHPDLLSWIGRERNRLVTCALTLLRGYIVAGQPSKGTVWGSFESWSSLIPGVLRWLEQDDPLFARATADDMLDEQRQNLIHVLVALEKLDPKRNGLTSRAIIQRLFPPRERSEPLPADEFEDMREAIEGITRCMPGRTPDAIRFSKYLAKNRGRVVLGRKIERATVDSDANVIRWTVTRTDTTPSVSLS
jgi:hypothetical protein